MSSYVIDANGNIYYLTGVAYSAQINENVVVPSGYSTIDQFFTADQGVVTDTATASLIAENPVSDSLVGQDGTGFGNILFALLGEQAGSSDTVSPSNHTTDSVADSLSLFDVSGGYSFSLQELAELIALADQIAGVYSRELSDSITVQDDIKFIFEVILSSVFKVISGTTAAQNARMVVEEVCRCIAATLLAFPIPIEESIQWADSFTAQRLLTATRAEIIKVASATLSQGRFASAIADALLVAMITGSGLGVAVGETISTSALSIALTHFIVSQGDSCVATDSVASTRRLLISISDQAVIIDPPSGESFNPTQLLNILVTEQIEFRIGWIADDGLWDGYVINTNTNAVSEYQGWDFNSFAEFYGKYLGASPTQGLAQMGGSADGANPILATLQTAVTDFGSGHQKRVRSAYLGIAAEGTCYLQVLTDDNTARTYQLVANAPGLGNQRVDLARGVQSRYWSFSLESTDGSAWRLDNLEVLPVVLSRRVR